MGLYSLIYLCRIVRFEMIELVTVETHFILLIIVKDMPSLSTLMEFELMTRKPVCSPILPKNIIAALDSSSCAELALLLFSSYAPSSRSPLVVIPVVPLTGWKVAARS